MSTTTTTHLRTCHLCEAMCGLELRVTDGEVTSIRGDAEDPFSRGHICPKGAALGDVHGDPARLRSPVRRTANGWEPIGWAAALDLAAGEIHRLQRDHGERAVGVYVGNPAVHNLGIMVFGPQFLRTLRTRCRYSATSVDQLAQMLASLLMFGHQLLIPIPDIDHTHHMLIVGGNPLVSNGSIMSAPGVRGRLRAIGDRGGKVVVVDPCRTQTAKLAHEHVFIRPGTDALLLLAMVHTILDEGLEDLGALADLCRGLDEVRRAVRPFTAARSAEATGIGADTIRRLARELAAAPSAACYGRVGTASQPFSSMCAWAIYLLNILTGNLDRRGGVMFTTPALDVMAMPKGVGLGPGRFDRFRSRVRGLPEFGGELPVATLAEDILTPGDDRIRGFITIAGNPVLSTPNGRQLDEALRSLELMVSLDGHINATSRHAHLILPPLSPLERSHYDVAFHALAVRNTARYSPPVFEPPAGALDDWQILLGIQARLERLRGKHGLASRATLAGLRRLGPEGLLDLGLRAGPFGARPWRRGLSVASLRRSPHGVDLGPLEPRLPERLPAGHRHIDLAPTRLLETLAELDAAVAAPASDVERPFLLIGRRELRSNNSWMHNVARLMKGGDRCTLMMHPDDAGSLGVGDGARVRVSSRVGAVDVAVEVNEDLMPGVVSLPHGYGHGREGVENGVVPERVGVSINDLTDEQHVDPLCGAAVLTGVPVSITPA